MSNVAQTSYSTVNVPAPSVNPNANETESWPVSTWQCVLELPDGSTETETINVPAGEVPPPDWPALPISGPDPNLPTVITPWHVINTYDVSYPVHTTGADVLAGALACAMSRVGVTALGDALAVAWADGNDGSTLGQLNFMIFDPPDAEYVRNINDWGVQAGPVALGETSYVGCDLAQDHTGQWLQFGWSGTDLNATPNVATAMTVGSLPAPGSLLPNKIEFTNEMARYSTSVASGWYSGEEGQPDGLLAAWTGTNGPPGNLNICFDASIDNLVLDETSPAASRLIYLLGGDSEPTVLSTWRGADMGTSINILNLGFEFLDGTKYVIDTPTRSCPALATPSPVPLVASNDNFPWYMVWTDATTGRLAVAAASESFADWQMMTLLDASPPMSDPSIAYLPAVNMLAIGYLDAAWKVRVGFLPADTSLW